VHRLRAFKNRVLRRIFGPKKYEVIGEQRKLHNGKLHNLYSSPNIISRSNQGKYDGWGMWHSRKRTKVYKVLVGRPEGKRPLERPGRRWEDGIKMFLREIGWRVGGWSGLTWLRIGTVGGLL
jgi:hypothetical protein